MSDDPVHINICTNDLTTSPVKEMCTNVRPARDRAHFPLSEMELKVSVDGVECSVSGVSNDTTCAQIIYALAHATSQKGRFVMIEKFRKKERRLSPIDKPIELLEKWREHRSNVSFVLRKVDEEERTVEFPCSPSSTTFQNFSNSFMPSSVSTGVSTTSLLSVSSRLPDRNRPPPPDYNVVMEQKFASIGRSANLNSTLQDEDNSVAKMSLSQNDLLVLIEKQRLMIERQRENLLNTELTLPSEADRELLQLQRQHENLRNILTPIKDFDWPQQYQKQLKKSHKLRAAIEATKEAINKTMSDVEKMLCEEVELQKKISELNESPSTPPRAAATLPISSSTSSPTLKAC
ncbi:hypothetical protein KIN20_031424 [Parelaphostrongylus tenuis]|uniref:Ras-associating domain-containing protein n=1 Tax=Parelaphostrongylus tenuis TaxID=148309 RepID=A0AAD5WGS9_PARTN|nr:hypothetical protein KIN20_031424 [Parelaphostrongylus tenuis]